MPIALTVNGVTYNYPKLGDENWGQDATNWTVGITQLVNSLNNLVNNTLIAGLFEFANGSAVTPSLRFQNSLSTGIYRVSADTLGFTAAGVAAGQISSSGLLRWKDGSAAAPAFSFVNDAGSGMFRAGANQLGFATNGTEAMQIDASQNVNLAAGLSVVGSSSLGGVTFSALQTVTLNDNQAVPAPIFSVPAVGNEAIVVQYSILRGANRETGTMHLTNDGTSVDVEVENRPLNDAGIEFSAAISGSNVELLYTSTSTGTAGTIKFFTMRWAH